jgi:hypothetical protein
MPFVCGLSFEFSIPALIIHPMHYDLCLPWYSEDDADFIRLIERAGERLSTSVKQVTPGDLLAFITGLYTGQVSFGTLLDRAQGDPRFLPINRWSRERGIRCLNPDEVSARASDKATMHFELITGGIDTPYTIILSSFVEQPILRPVDIAPLGPRFMMKPALGGGGEGVVEIGTMEEIIKTRLDYPEQKYLVQARIEPMGLEGRPAWFRVLYAGGKTWPCWWHPRTHEYKVLSEGEESLYGLGRLRQVTMCIASICRLDWFSTEIAVTPEGRFISVDYVNDQIDLRLQSKAADGVPDQLAEQLADQLVAMAKA